MTKMVIIKYSMADFIQILKFLLSSKSNTLDKTLDYLETKKLILIYGIANIEKWRDSPAGAAVVNGPYLLQTDSPDGARNCIVVYPSETNSTCGALYSCLI